jgi:NUMOD3 motif
MLVKICEQCTNKFTLPKAGKKEQARRFCGPICSRRWAANNRSDTWKKKASIAKQGENNPMFGISQSNPNSLANLTRSAWTGKQHSLESNKKRSKSLTGIKRSKETINKIRQTKLSKGIIWKPDDPEYLEFKKYRRKVYYWTSKNDLTLLENYDKRGKIGYHLDHKYSIAEGFRNKVPPKIIGSIDNLEFLLYTDNVKKGTSCSITLEKLYGLQSSRH